MQQIEKYHLHFGEVPGWFEKDGIALWDSLLDFQERSSIAGDLMEIGVWMGKSASMMALHCRPQEECFFVDINPMPEASGVISKAVPEARCEYIVQSDETLRRNPLLKKKKGAVRWFHIDGGHSAADVTRDLAIADGVLHARGMLAMDDFFSPGYPQVTHAIFQYIAKNPKSFCLVLSAHHKGYLCRPKAAGEYLKFMKDSLYKEMAQRGCPDITVWKTNGPHELNAFGITVRQEDADYRGLDLDKSKILI